jgi:hypothetical protein
LLVLGSWEEIGYITQPTLVLFPLSLAAEFFFVLVS